MGTQALQVRILWGGPAGAIDPLYLFACQVEWRKRCSQAAGTELLFALASPDAKIRLVAEALLEACK
jgi:hypothetical protein